MARLSEDTMYQAVISNEQRYDGVFFYAVKTTGIVCRPSCKSKVPNRENVIFFDTVDDALQQGYRVCKRCRPDLRPGDRAELDAVFVACDILNQEYANPDLLHELPLRIGISSSHLQRLFKKAVGQTTKEYLQKLRITKAAELLVRSNLSNIDVCMESGFANLSTFYVAFRSETGLSPKEYRQEQGNKKSL